MNIMNISRELEEAGFKVRWLKPLAPGGASAGARLYAVVCDQCLTMDNHHKHKAERMVRIR